MTHADTTGRAAPPPRHAPGAIPEIRTERLTLRAPTLADWPAYAAFYASGRSAIIGGPHDEGAAWRRFAADAGHWQLHGYGWWTVDDGAGPVGTCGVHFPPTHHAPELGWTLYESATGRGYATEAAVAARDWWQARHPGPLTSNIHAENAASQRVAARLGARPEPAPLARVPDVTAWVHPPSGFAA